MNALAGPAMLLVIAGGVALYRACSPPSSPPRSFLDAEVAAPANPDGHTGTCYSLSTVMVANAMYSAEVITWKQVNDDTWEMAYDDVEQGDRGPRSTYRRYTFEKHGDLVHLRYITTSGKTDTDVTRNLTALLRAPNHRSTPVDRCLEPGATGYLFKPRR